MNITICNIPHSGTEIPGWALEDMLISQDDLQKLSDFMIDKDVDKLWGFVPEEDRLLARYSRIIVDTERFRNDSEEPMAQIGMGLYYTHKPDGTEFRKRSAASYRRCLEIYDAFHKRLEASVAARLDRYGKCRILDCHSFHDRMDYMGFAAEDFPDVCIGTNGEVSKEARWVIDAFRNIGFSVKVNVPFSGSIVPLSFLNNGDVVSVMIELNRRIYDNGRLDEITAVCREIYGMMNE